MYNQLLISLQIEEKWYTFRLFFGILSCYYLHRLSNLLNEKEYAYTTFTNDAMRMSQKYIIRPRSLLIEGYIAF